MTTALKVVVVTSIQNYTNMSKAVRYVVPFTSNDGTNYRVDIYKEGFIGRPQQLITGDQPFVTEENSSDDFFCPVRSQTGTLQICTDMPDGGTIRLEDILPADNISCPIRLVSIGANNTETIVWQGFLSCEAYSQDYTEIPQILSIPIISVLEAMASVPLDQTRSHGLATLSEAIYNALNEINVQSGMTFYTHVRYSMTSWRIFQKIIDQSVFFKENEYTHENGTVYIVNGISSQDVLKILCTFMGWIVREQGTEILFEYIGETLGMYQETFTNFGTNFHQQGTPSAQITSADMEDLEWMGTDHQRSIMQGAKSVEVVAKIQTNDFNLKLPDFPFGDTTTLEWIKIKYQSNTWKYLYDLFNNNNNNNAYSNIAYGYYSGQLTRRGDSQYTFAYLGASTKSAFFSRMSLLPQSPQPAIYKNPMVAGAAFMRYAIEDEQTSTHNMQTGLYCPLLPGAHGQDAPIFKMWTPKRSAFLNGHFNIKADMLFNALYRYNSANEQIMSDKINDSYIACDGEKLDMVLKVGDKYWTGSDWTDTRTIFQATMTEGGIDVDIPVNQYLSGQVQIEVLAGVTITHINTLYEVIFKSLEVSFAYNEDYQASNRSENHYFSILETNFRDEIGINTEIATWLNNQPSPSIVRVGAAAGQAMTEMTYYTSTGSESRRPEVDLLNRLAAYYGAARQRLELKTTHPASAALSLIKYNGISPDTRKYLPLSESRDWKSEECTITCFETI